jgi:hypothetical protein
MFRCRSVRLLLLGLAGALAVYVARVLRGDPAPVFSGTPSAPPPDTGPMEVPKVPKVAVPPVAPSVAPSPAWVDAEGAGTSPSHPVKGKLKSGIYHLPGMLNYDRTVPDRWYRDAAAAEADGLRIAKR